MCACVRVHVFVRVLVRTASLLCLCVSLYARVNLLGKTRHEQPPRGTHTYTHAKTTHNHMQTSKHEKIKAHRKRVCVNSLYCQRDASQSSTLTTHTRRLPLSRRREGRTGALSAGWSWRLLGCSGACMLGCRSSAPRARAIGGKARPDLKTNLACGARPEVEASARQVACNFQISS